ncbi:cytochrome c oxidase subunit II [Synechococcus sp. CS-602]|uniref:cytochrome c oxidase subunit II n=1 Tax=Synechococcaceae TaxID=1890426 RepID=UPI0008FF3098|nr:MULTISPECIES: cytochrome c oxidase subunit II [Synechococcaceae]MCT4363372.1 cytochrome c oxidase subunit II [Candidatus Regnicoccus frigidus MAG-AL1]APD48679.1 cytochrome C oxidase subunit II [Synechococcus sp. SynAce01]MCT0202190.1 cytochrome c oxidase subunit II [Synechococcus sp. CS-603]MCT0205190.1 cytochrome c oxidase subunit II [Synechococcus sp. CS-602]MCT0245709.1 cytochrome c oxidase subunit II [Synechococcus sp. CS-601]
MTSTPSRPNLPAIAGLVFWIGLLVWFSFWMGQQSFGWLPVQASSAAPLVDGLFSFETAVATFVFAGVVSVMAWVMLFNRAAKYDISDAEPIEGNTKLEIIWTVIPLLLVMGIAYYTIDVNRQIGLIGPMDHVHGDRLASDQQPASGAAVAPQAEIEVIARQWSWEFRYPGAAVSATELHLPLDRRVGLQLRSEDVIHGFYVPAFRLKQQVIPGRSIAFFLTPTREGRYRLRDSEYSGTWFAANQVDVVVQSETDYQDWLRRASRLPLQPGLSDASREYALRQSRTRPSGYATVVPAPPPMVNVPGSNTLPHDG